MMPTFTAKHNRKIHIYDNRFSPYPFIGTAIVSIKRFFVSSDDIKHSAGTSYYGKS